MINKAGRKEAGIGCRHPLQTRSYGTRFAIISGNFQAGKGNVQEAKKKISFSVVHYHKVYVNFLPGMARRSCWV